MRMLRVDPQAAHILQSSSVVDRFQAIDKGKLRAAQGVLWVGMDDGCDALKRYPNRNGVVSRDSDCVCIYSCIYISV